MTKEIIRAAIQETSEQLAALERQHPGQEMRPWSCGDHPIAVQHWKLVQKRIRLKKELGRPAFTAEQKAARASRMREKHTARRILCSQNADNTLSGNQHP